MRGGRAVCFVLLLAAACGGEVSKGEEPDERAVALLDAAAFAPVSADEDPLAAHRPVRVTCPEGAYLEEDGALELQTGYCNYAALAQPLLADVQPGERVHLVLLHDRLVFEEAAQAHVALLLAGRVIWERSVAIPSEAAVYDETIELSVGAEAGEPVMLHRHNHGYNAWKLLTVERLP
jgi:hypothetical protein